MWKVILWIMMASIMTALIMIGIDADKNKELECKERGGNYMSFQAWTKLCLSIDGRVIYMDRIIR